MDVLTLFLFSLGFVFLTFGADILIHGASLLAKAFGISPLVVGLTVVAFGTSAPELAISVRSALATQAGADIALGNVVGSNICNILLILGLAAAVAPLVVSKQLIQRDLPFMIGLSGLVYVLGLDQKISRLEGLFLFLMLLCYIGFSIGLSKKQVAKIHTEYATEPKQPVHALLINIVQIALGLALLVTGSKWLVEGAVAIAHNLGISDLVIGLSVVSLGTSLPEAATSMIASFRGETDIAVGNVVGSNIFNILAVLGLSSFVSPFGVNIAPAALAVDIPVMIAVAVVCLPVFFTNYLVSRLEGLVFIGYYFAYILWLLFNSVQHQYLSLFSIVMLQFIIPLTVFMLIALSFRQFRADICR